MTSLPHSESCFASEMVPRHPLVFPSRNDTLGERSENGDAKRDNKNRRKIMTKRNKGGARNVDAKRHQLHYKFAFVCMNSRELSEPAIRSFPVSASTAKSARFCARYRSPSPRFTLSFLLSFTRYPISNAAASSCACIIWQPNGRLEHRRSWQCDEARLPATRSNAVAHSWRISAQESAVVFY